MYGGHFKNYKLTAGFTSETTSVLDVIVSSTSATVLVCETSAQVVASVATEDSASFNTTATADNPIILRKICIGLFDAKRVCIEVAFERDGHFSGREGMVDRNDLYVAPKHRRRARAENENRAVRGNMIIRKPTRRGGGVAVAGSRRLRY